MEPVIRLQGVTKRYGTQVALDRVSLEVPPGVVFALLGENGAGKTTTIRLLLGLTEPDAGQTTVLGLDSARQGLILSASRSILYASSGRDFAGAARREAGRLRMEIERLRASPGDSGTSRRPGG